MRATCPPQTPAEILRRLRERGLDSVVADIAARANVTVYDILSHDRHQKIVEARHEFFAALRALRFSWPEIARLAGVDHSTARAGALKHGLLATAPKVGSGDVERAQVAS